MFFPVALGHERRDVQRLHLRRGISKHPCRRLVPENHFAVPVDGDNGITGSLGDRLELSLTLDKLPHSFRGLTGGPGPDQFGAVSGYFFLHRIASADRCAMLVSEPNWLFQLIPHFCILKRSVE